jgi:hypothetical protein
LPLHRNAGVIACAGEPGEPSENTSDTVPVSVIGPLVIGGFVDV